MFDAGSRTRGLKLPDRRFHFFLRDGNSILAKLTRCMAGTERHRADPSQFLEIDNGYASNLGVVSSCQFNRRGGSWRG